jgi:hypothetical protein
VECVTGWGRHSKGGKAKLRNAVQNFLLLRENREQFNYTAAAGAGHFIIELFPLGTAPRPISPSDFEEVSNGARMVGEVSSSCAVAAEDGPRNGGAD